jgi:hypothetical protein
MARIYAAGNGNEPIQRPHFAERPLNELLDLLKISRSQEWSASGPVRREPDPGSSFVQIEVERNEGEDLGWEDGWHLVRMPESEAKNRLTLVHQER